MQTSLKSVRLVFEIDGIEVTVSADADGDPETNANGELTEAQMEEFRVIHLLVGDAISGLAAKIRYRNAALARAKSG